MNHNKDGSRMQHIIREQLLFLIFGVSAHQQERNQEERNRRALHHGGLTTMSIRPHPSRFRRGSTSAIHSSLNPAKERGYLVGAVTLIEGGSELYRPFSGVSRADVEHQSHIISICISNSVGLSRIRNGR